MSNRDAHVSPALRTPPPPHAPAPCPRCGSTLRVSSGLCPSCGMELPAVPASPPPIPRGSPPLTLIAGVMAADWGTIKLIRMLLTLAGEWLHKAESSGELGFTIVALLIAVLALPCLALLAISIPLLLGEGWARIAGGIMHGVAAVLVLPWASGQHWSPPLLWVLGLWAALLIVLFLPSAGRYCVRAGGKAYPRPQARRTIGCR